MFVGWGGSEIAARQVPLLAMTNEMQPSSLVSSREHDFVCECGNYAGDGLGSSCAGLPFYESYEGKRFCVLHFPEDSKLPDFVEEINRKIQNSDYDFRGVWFPRVTCFQSFVFREGVDFSYATFSPGIVFTEAKFTQTANFSQARFLGEADFSGATLRMANFTEAVFDAKAIFEKTTFQEGTSYNKVCFSNSANFRGAQFESHADFCDSTFEGEAIFDLVRINGKVVFNSATFCKRATFFESELGIETSFKRSNFYARARFKGSKFGTYTDFSSTRFYAKLSLRNAIFGEKVDFTKAHFDKELHLSEAEFENVIFSKATFARRAMFFGARFGEADFSGALFHRGATFAKARFSGDANFFRTRFLGRVNFNAVTFLKEAKFFEVEIGGEAKFFGVNFGDYALFSGALFSHDVTFSRAVFKSNVSFIRVVFAAGVDFHATMFLGSAKFAGDDNKNLFCSLDNSCVFQHAIVEQPKRFSFRTAVLRPNWFIDVDTQMFQFSDVDWHGTLDEEILAARDKMASPYRLLSETYRRLTLNAEANRRNLEASTFTYWALDANRKERWYGFVPWRLDWWYWLSSGYGERHLRAAVWLFVILLSFAVVYTLTGFPAGKCETFENCGRILVTQSMPYSLGNMTLQRPEPRPEVGPLQLLIFFQGVLGPLQAALFALALRRKYMR